jgi:hypothetical protein
VLRDRFAPSTWNRRKYLQRMLLAYATATRRKISSPMTAILTLEWIGTGTMRRTLLGYARTLRAMYKQLKSSQEMDDYVAGLNAMAANEPLHQAGTLQQHEVIALLSAPNHQFRQFAWLVWMTASRWADVQGLTSQRLSFSPEGLVVDFQGVTKSSRKKPFRLDHVVMIPRGVTNLEAIRTWAINCNLLPKMSTSAATLFMRRLLNRPDVSAHSLKRTALEVLLREVERGTITHRLVAQMAKHLGIDPLLPDVTVGYIQNRTLLAATNGSSTATRILDNFLLRVPEVEVVPLRPPASAARRSARLACL